MKARVYLPTQRAGELSRGTNDTFGPGNNDILPQIPEGSVGCAKAADVLASCTELLVMLLQERECNVGMLTQAWYGRQQALAHVGKKAAECRGTIPPSLENFPMQS